MAFHWTHYEGVPIRAGDMVQRCQAEGDATPGFWPSAWMRPLSDPDAGVETKRHTDKEAAT
jgi:hypothetical protein